jgi:hypothetical protein
MVTSYSTILSVGGWLLAAGTTGPAIERLDPPRRAAVVMALLALVLTGLLLVTCVMLGAHWARRLARHRPPSGRPTGVAFEIEGNRRVRAALESILPSLKTADTLHIDASTKETKVDL